MLKSILLLFFIVFFTSDNAVTEIVFAQQRSSSTSYDDRQQRIVDLLGNQNITNMRAGIPKESALPLLITASVTTTLSGIFVAGAASSVAFSGARGIALFTLSSCSSLTMNTKPEAAVPMSEVALLAYLLDSSSRDRLEFYSNNAPTFPMSLLPGTGFVAGTSAAAVSLQQSYYYRSAVIGFTVILILALLWVAYKHNQNKQEFKKTQDRLNAKVERRKFIMNEHQRLTNLHDEWRWNQDREREEIMTQRRIIDTLTEEQLAFEEQQLIDDADPCPYPPIPKIPPPQNPIIPPTFPIPIALRLIAAPFLGYWAMASGAVSMSEEVGDFVLALLPIFALCALAVWTLTALATALQNVPKPGNTALDNGKKNKKKKANTINAPQEKDQIETMMRLIPSAVIPSEVQDEEIAKKKKHEKLNKSKSNNTNNNNNATRREFENEYDNDDEDINNSLSIPMMRNNDDDPETKFTPVQNACLEMMSERGRWWFIGDFIWDSPLFWEAPGRSIQNRSTLQVMQTLLEGANGPWQAVNIKTFQRGPINSNVFQKFSTLHFFVAFLITLISCFMAGYSHGIDNRDPYCQNAKIVNGVLGILSFVIQLIFKPNFIPFRHFTMLFVELLLAIASLVALAGTIDVKVNENRSPKMYPSVVVVETLSLSAAIIGPVLMSIVSLIGFYKMRKGPIVIVSRFTAKVQMLKAEKRENGEDVGDDDDGDSDDEGNFGKGTNERNFYNASAMPGHENNTMMNNGVANDVYRNTHRGFDAPTNTKKQNKRNRVNRRRNRNNNDDDDDDDEENEEDEEYEEEQEEEEEEEEQENENYDDRAYYDHYGGNREKQLAPPERQLSGPLAAIGDRIAALFDPNRLIRGKNVTHPDWQNFEEQLDDVLLSTRHANNVSIVDELRKQRKEKKQNVRMEPLSFNHITEMLDASLTIPARSANYKNISNNNNKTEENQNVGEWKNETGEGENDDSKKKKKRNKDERGIALQYTPANYVPIDEQQNAKPCNDEHDDDDDGVRDIIKRRREAKEKWNKVQAAIKIDANTNFFEDNNDQEVLQLAKEEKEHRAKLMESGVFSTGSGALLLPSQSNLRSLVEAGATATNTANNNDNYNQINNSDVNDEQNNISNNHSVDDFLGGLVMAPQDFTVTTNNFNKKKKKNGNDDDDDDDNGDASRQPSAVLNQQNPSNSNSFFLNPEASMITNAATKLLSPYPKNQGAFGLTKQEQRQMSGVFHPDAENGEFEEEEEIEEEEEEEEQDEEESGEQNENESAQPKQQVIPPFVREIIGAHRKVQGWMKETIRKRPGENKKRILEERRKAKEDAKAISLADGADLLPEASPKGNTIDGWFKKLDESEAEERKRWQKEQDESGFVPFSALDGALGRKDETRFPSKKKASSPTRKEQKRQYFSQQEEENQARLRELLTFEQMEEVVAAKNLKKKNRRHPQPAKKDDTKTEDLPSMVAPSPTASLLPKESTKRDENAKIADVTDDRLMMLLLPSDERKKIRAEAKEKLRLQKIQEEKEEEEARLKAKAEEEVEERRKTQEEEQRKKLVEGDNDNNNISMADRKRLALQRMRERQQQQQQQVPQEQQQQQQRNSPSVLSSDEPPKSENNNSNTTNSRTPSTPLDNLVEDAKAKRLALLRQKRQQNQSQNQTAPTPNIDEQKPVSPAPVLSFQEQVLQSHNKLRQLHGSPPLVWDDELATHAASCAYRCWSSGKLEHTTDIYSASGETEGQNIFFSSNAKSLNVDASIAANSWYHDEIGKYDFTSSFTRMNGNSEALHFSQVVWKATTKVGAAISPCGKYLVANYYPGGNVNGKFFVNVQKP